MEKSNIYNVIKEYDNGIDKESVNNKCYHFESYNNTSEAIEKIRNIVNEKDEYTRKHSDRVSEYAVLIGKKIGFSEEQLNTLRIGSLLHDIGKIEIPDDILKKETKLSDEEYMKMKKHSLIGSEILAESLIKEDDEMYQNIIPIVKYHHERYDGKGYPENLSGEDIPLMARITAVADTYDAMSSNRVYRKGLDNDVIVEEIKKNRGTQFDPMVADAFLDVLENDKEGIKRIQDKY